MNQSPSERVNAPLSKCRANFARHTWSLPDRIERIKTLNDITIRNRIQIRSALREDYRRHADILSDIVECAAVAARCSQAIEQIECWAASEPRQLDENTFGTARAEMVWQPKGVIGNIVPWNFPFELGLSPLAEMIAAGNRIVIKPSELAPACARLLAQIIASAFPDDEITTILGGADVAAAFASAKFDHLMFTGSTEIGRRVMALAAPNLTPLTLELGGKCPVVVGSGGLDARAIESIVGLKLAKGGQICVTVDHILVPRAELDRLVAQITTYTDDALADFSTGSSVTGLISPRHFDRVSELVEDARERGARIIDLEAGTTVDPERRVMPLRLVIDPPTGSRILHEEVFGPVLPIVAVDDFDDAIKTINAGGSPLGIYVFSDNQAEIDRLILHTRSGGVTVNGAALHSASPNLGFGGIGDSGFGRHHGVEGFREFSNHRAILVRGPVDATDFIFPPYSESKEQAADLLFAEMNAQHSPQVPTMI